MANDEVFVKTALNAWGQWSGRASKIFDSWSDEQLLSPIAAGKNRAVYILGHLLSVDDSMIPQLRLGEAKYLALREIFVTQPDGAVAELPALSDLRQQWKEVHGYLDTSFAQFTPAEWLERHSSVSEEDFAREPHRNRLAILLSRTGHLSYHVGQLILAK